MTYRFLVQGAGPSGLYITKLIFRRFKSSAIVDMIEKDPVAGGLLRWGVAPDHPEVKSALKNFDELFEMPNFYFFGNLNLNENHFDYFKENYSAIITATGAKNYQDLNIPIVSRNPFPIIQAMDFVNFYNQRPLKSCPNIAQLVEMKNIRKVVIIGNGNVSLDIARLLTKDRQALSKFQIGQDFFSFLDKNDLQEISIIGRRGVVQAACSVKELRELLNQSTFNPRSFKQEIENGLIAQSLEEMDQNFDIKRRTNKKKFEIFAELSSSSEKKNKEDKNLYFRFLLSPSKIFERDGKCFLQCHKTRLEGNSMNLKAVENEGQVEEIECDLVIKSLGFSNNAKNNKIRNSGKDFLYKCGWASNDGKGTLADSYADCEQKESILANDLKFDPIIFDQKQSFLSSYLSEIQKTKESDSFFIIRKEQYKNFRKKEIYLGKEIKDLSIIENLID